MKLAKKKKAPAFLMMGVTQIHILLANTKSILTAANNNKNPIYEKGCPSQSTVAPIPLCFPSISLGLFGRYLTAIL